MAWIERAALVAWSLATCVCLAAFVIGVHKPKHRWFESLYALAFWTAIYMGLSALVLCIASIYKNRLGDGAVYLAFSFLYGVIWPNYIRKSYEKAREQRDR